MAYRVREQFRLGSVSVYWPSSCCVVPRDTGPLYSEGPEPTTRVVGSGPSLYSGPVSLGTTQQDDGQYTLTDPSRNCSRTLYAMNASGSTPFFDNNNQWSEPTDNPRHKGAVDAHYGM